MTCLQTNLILMDAEINRGFLWSVREQAFN